MNPRPDSGQRDEELCIPGGVFVLGDARTKDLLGLVDVEGWPERIVQLSPFLLDRYEVSVGRFRGAMNDPTHPFKPPREPTRPDAALACGSAINFRYCTWYGADGADDPKADALPVNCVTQETARAFCQWAGGDLPTEAQWEYAATQAFRVNKTVLPWGTTSPSCDIAAYGRFSSVYSDAECGRDVVCGPLPVDAPFGAGPPTAECVGGACVRDETPGPSGRGVIGMGGGVSEWVRDAKVPFDSPCWNAAPRLDPICENVPGATQSMYRGGSWLSASWLLIAVLRSGGVDDNPLLSTHGAVGFRCARPGSAP
jgi:formylglycine-generating enzyme required for sulfatase activity